MKKTIFLIMVLQWAILSSVFAGGADEPTFEKEIKTSGFSAVIINTDVTVHLLNNSDDMIRLNGDDIFMQNIVVRQKGNNLVIEAAKNRNYRNRGIIYIPAAMLKHLEVNSAAHIQSAGILHIPRLNVLVNGACKINISNKGELNLKGTEFYGVNYVMKDARFPFVIIDAQEN